MRVPNQKISSERIQEGGLGYELEDLMITDVNVFKWGFWDA